MRIQFVFRSTSPKAGRPNKHAIQGLIYKSLQNSAYGNLHDVRKAKNFTFSDWFSINGGATFHISSSSPDLIQTVYDYYRENLGMKFLDYSLEKVEQYETRKTRIIRTGSPIVLTEKNDRYLSFKRKTLDLDKFDRTLRDKAAKRYRDFTNDADFILDKPLFEELELRKEIPVPVKMAGREFIIIGSTWNKLVLRNDPSLRDFYSWLIEEGLGEKRSLGFGYLQPYKLGGKRK